MRKDTYGMVLFILVWSAAYWGFALGKYVEQAHGIRKIEIPGSCHIGDMVAITEGGVTRVWAFPDPKNIWKGAAQ